MYTITLLLLTSCSIISRTLLTELGSLLSGLKSSCELFSESEKRRVAPPRSPARRWL